MLRHVLRVELLLGAIAMSTLLGYGAEAVRGTAPTSEALFAQQYIRALHDSGVAGVSSRSKAALVAEPKFAESVEILRKVLATETRDSLVLSAWEVERRRDQPKTTKIVYDVVGLADPVQIGIWMEEEDGHFVANTLFFGRPKSSGAD